MKNENGPGYAEPRALPSPSSNPAAAKPHESCAIVPRRPCRVCGRHDARPVVPIGSSRWWDLCALCTGVVMRRSVTRV